MRNALLVWLAACSGPTVVVGDFEEVRVLKAIPNRDLDILFVVDNSPSMMDEQASLAQNFPRMMDVLSTLDDGLPNLHIGVVTSDLGTSSSLTAPGPSIGSGPGACEGWGDNGELVQSPSVTDRYISDISGATGRIVNYTGALRDAFASLALVGDLGCGFEQHLRAMTRALDDHPVNAGFLRPEANLAVVILADEDDCSLADSGMLAAFTGTLGSLASYRCFRFGVQCTPDDPLNPGARSGCTPRQQSQYVDDVSPFADFLVNLKGDPRNVMVAGVVGDPTPVGISMQQPPGGGSLEPTLDHSCTYTSPMGDLQVADPAVRLATFFDLFPGRSQLTSICNPDLSGALSDIGMTAKALMGDPCVDITQLADTSPDPGIQPACEVVDIRDSAPDEHTAVPFELVADAIACPTTPDHLRLQLHRTSAIFADTWTHFRCAR